MCFSIPYKIISIEKDLAVLEDGRKIKFGKEISAMPGEYLQITGNIAVGKLTEKEGLRIRSLIKSLN
jgi:hypothetical protein